MYQSDVFRKYEINYQIPPALRSVTESVGEGGLARALFYVIVKPSMSPQVLGLLLLAPISRIATATPKTVHIPRKVHLI